MRSAGPLWSSGVVVPGACPVWGVRPSDRRGAGGRRLGAPGHMQFSVRRRMRVRHASAATAGSCFPEALNRYLRWATPSTSLGSRGSRSNQVCASPHPEGNAKLGNRQKPAAGMCLPLTPAPQITEPKLLDDLGKEEELPSFTCLDAVWLQAIDILF
jgi:hypothetical protein